MIHGLTLKKANGHSVACLEDIPAGAERIVIAIHGFTSSKESPTVQMLLRRLPAAGIGVVGIDLPCHGVEESYEEELRVGCVVGISLEAEPGEVESHRVRRLVVVPGGEALVAEERSAHRKVEVRRVVRGAYPHGRTVERRQIRPPIDVAPYARPGRRVERSVQSGHYIYGGRGQRVLAGAELLHGRARQLLDVQVTAQFYETAVADALIRSYESETNSTAALERRIGDLVGEGYATKPDLARVRTKAKNDRYELKKANDRAELARARLADILRFMPGEPALKADGASMMKVLENPRRLTLEDAVMESLTNRLDLFAADRVTKVREIEIYRALTEWLPEIAVAGGGNYANQELLATSQFWSGGIVGAMSLFKGFQSVNDYRKAKEERKAEYEILENRMMAVVVSVIDAYRNRERAEEGAAVARSAMESAQLDYDSAKDRFDEGRETFSHLMDKITALEKAKVRASSAEYARALTEIVLRNAIGENLK